MLLVGALLISLAINVILFLVAFSFKSDKLTDASYALSFLGIDAYLYFKSSSSLKAVAALMVALWAIRIGSFLVYRIIKAGKDRRFDGVRDNFWAFGRFWIGQALIAWILMIPLAFGPKKSALSILSVVGILIWFIGFIVEAEADIEKYRFRQQPENKNKWIASGLWGYSRHPNYFGEILVWLGVYICLFPNLNGAQRLIALISPLAIALLLVFVTGIPPLEKSAETKWGNNREYTDYKRQTSLIVPLPKRH